MFALLFDRSRRRIAPLALMAMLAACATGLDPNLTPEQQALRQEADRFNAILATGAVTGALLGGVLGYLIGDDPESALIGAAGGAVAGAAAGYYVASEGERYATLEEELGAKTQMAQAAVNNNQVTVTNAERVVAQQKARIATLGAQLRNGQLNRDQYTQEIASAERDIRALQAIIEGNQEQINNITVDINSLRSRGADTRNLEVAKRQLERQQSELLDQLDALVTAYTGDPLTQRV